MHTAKEEARAGEEYVHAETTFVFIYVSESLSSLLRVPERKPVDALTRHCSMLAIRQTHAKQISLYWDCHVTALPSRHRSVGSMYPSIWPGLDPTFISIQRHETQRCTIHQRYVPRHVAVRFSSYPSPIKHIYTRALVMFHLWTNRTSQKAIAIAHCYRCSLYLSYQKKNYYK